MDSTAFAKRLATEIVRSWEQTKSNYIIMAPPLSNPESVFHLLGQQSLLSEGLGDHGAGVAIAKLGPQDYRDEYLFATKIAEKWGVRSNRWGDLKDPGVILQIATHCVLDARRTPIVLIPRFHEALGRLGEDVGIALRELENTVHLKTVVELPVSLSVLRARWEAMEPDKVPFLRSDWGQAHTEVLLNGYSRDEVLALVEKKGVSNEGAALWNVTGGLPELVDALVDDVTQMTVPSFEHFAKHRAPGLCRRLLEWLDKPNDTLFTRLVVQSIATPNARTGVMSLRDHCWAKVLIRDDGALKSRVVGWACLDKMQAQDGPSLSRDLKSAFASRQYDAIDRTLRACAELQSTAVAVESLIRMNRFASVANPFDVEWVSEGLSALPPDADKSVPPCEDPVLGPWRWVVGLLSAFASARRINAELRLEQFVCERRSDDLLAAYLQLLRWRIDVAGALPHPHLSLKCIVEVPESVVQVYAFVQMHITFWRFDGISDEVAAKVATRTRRPFDKPKMGSQLNFYELLQLVAVGMAGLEKRGCPLVKEDSIARLLETYEQRKLQVHSAAFVSTEEWADYKAWCELLIDAAWKAFDLDKHDPRLPSIDARFHCLVDRAFGVGEGAIVAME